MEARVARLEEDMREVKSVLSRLEPVIMRMDTFIMATMPHLATKADLAESRAELKGDISALRTEMKSDISALRTEMKSDISALRDETKSDIGAIRLELAEKPSKTYMWGVLAVLITAYGAGLAALAVLK
jgi:hypothetical protein